MLLLQILVLGVFPLLVVTAAMRDATSFIIPNWISLAALCAFLPAAALAGLAPAAIGLALAVGFAALVIGIVMFALGWIGGGDAKLLAACAVWLGWSAFGHFIALTCVAGGFLAVGLLLVRKVSFWLPPRLPAWMRRLATPGESAPYGVAIAAGALAVFPSTPLAGAVLNTLVR